MNRLSSTVLGLVIAATSAFAWAQDTKATRDEAIALVNAAAAHVQKVGPDQAYKDFNDKANAAWHKKDLYVFVNRFDGMTLAHGGNEKLIGKDMSGLKDQDGKAFVQDMIATAKKSGNGWIEYSWVHPETKKLAAKAAYVRALPSANAFVGAGIYQ